MASPLDILIGVGHRSANPACPLASLSMIPKATGNVPRALLHVIQYGVRTTPYMIIRTNGEPRSTFLERVSCDEGVLAHLSLACSKNLVAIIAVALVPAN